VACFCEGEEKSLQNRLRDENLLKGILEQHVNRRKESEEHFFRNYNSSTKDIENTFFIKKGEINSKTILEKIKTLKPELLVCFGSSIIKGDLIDSFKGKIINVHLGLSPYYRGSGTNVWPLINSEPEYMGATFMYLDEGIDTGEIIHQIQTPFKSGDDPHSAGNRLIIEMTKNFSKLIKNFDDLSRKKQINLKGKLYLRKHFNEESCRILYRNFDSGLVNKYLKESFISNKKLYLIEDNLLIRG
jgi:methionyl-tRNA formyltransferase